MHSTHSQLLFKFCWLFSLLFSPSLFSAQDDSESALENLAVEIDLIVEEGLAAKAFPGAQLYVAQKGKVLLNKTYGHHTYDQKRAVQKNDLYDLASITKVTTGLPILMQLCGAGKFDLDAPLKNYFSKFKNSSKGELIIRDILAHQARLEPYIVYWQKTLKEDGSFKNRTFKNKPSKNYPIQITDQLFLHKKYKKRIHKYIKQSPLLAEQTYKYSGLFFLLLPDIIAALTGQRVDEYLYENIYRPIGAHNLVYNPLELFPPTQLVPSEYDSLFRKQQVQGRVHDEAAAMLGGLSCNAGLFGNAEDLGKLFQLYLDDGFYQGKSIIPKEAIAEFTRCQFCEKDNRRGLGFDKPLINYVPGKSHVAKDASPQSFGHGGFTGTFAWADPKHDLVVIFLSNRVYPTRNNRALYRLDIRPRLQQKVYDCILGQ